VACQNCEIFLNCANRVAPDGRVRLRHATHSQQREDFSRGWQAPWVCGSSTLPPSARYFPHEGVSARITQLRARHSISTFRTSPGNAAFCAANEAMPFAFEGRFSTLPS
jgi:hypothetical protein